MEDAIYALHWRAHAFLIGDIAPSYGHTQVGKLCCLRGCARAHHHFVTKRDAHGVIVETLADIPFEKRKELKQPNLKGLSWQQQKAWLEKTDGGRLT